MSRVLWLPALALAACYNPDIPDGMLHCGAQGQCPSGLTCVANVCYHDSVAKNLDLSVPDLSPPGPYGTGALGVLDLSGKSGILELDTETGAMTLLVGIADAGATDGGIAMMKIIDKQSDMFSVAQSSAEAPRVALWSFTSVTIPRGITIRPSLDSVSIPAIQSTGDLTFEGTAAWTGFGALGGGAGKSGGLPGSPGAAALGGGTDGSGGGGGGHALPGTKGAGPAGGVGGEAYGDANEAIVYTGAGGGGGGGAKGGIGGNGGGAFCLLAHHLVLGGSITVSGVDGVSGDPTAMAAGGGGGGAGGSILLSADSVSLESGNSFIAKGGMPGAGAGTGAAGGGGSPGRILLAAGMLVGAPNAMPAATVGTALTTFPR